MSYKIQGAIDAIKAVMFDLDSEFHPGRVQMFPTRNIVGDPTVTIYSNDGLVVEADFYHKYVEVIGAGKDGYRTIFEAVGLKE